MAKKTGSFVGGEEGKMLMWNKLIPDIPNNEYGISNERIKSLKIVVEAGEVAMAEIEYFSITCCGLVTDTYFVPVSKLNISFEISDLISQDDKKERDRLTKKELKKIKKNHKALAKKAMKFLKSKEKKK